MEWKKKKLRQMNYYGYFVEWKIQFSMQKWSVYKAMYRIDMYNVECHNNVL